MGFWKIPLIILTLIASAYAAHAIGLGEGNRFGRLGAISSKKGSAVALTNLRITNTGDFRITNTADNRAVSP